MHTPDRQQTSSPPATPDWSHVDIVSGDTIRLSPAEPTARIPVIVRNRSHTAVDPDIGEGLVFGISLWTADGERLPVESVRSPLSARITSGGEHYQWLTVHVPPEHIPQVSELRVGLLLQGEYWVENLHPAHSRKLSLEVGSPEAPAALEMALAERIWPKGANNLLRWPYSGMMASESQRLLYVPIAKCACTTLKTLMIELADVPRQKLASQMGVHWVTDRFNTGVQLKDKPMEVAREILASPDYFKFTVIRDPVERIISAYLEKFVYKRHNPRNLLHTRPVLEQVQQTADIDIERGITFEDFVAHITRCSPHDLDSHWRPQYLYIKGVPHFRGIYRLEHITQLANDLGKRLGRSITLDHQNRTEKSNSMLGGAARMLPGDIEAAGSIDPNSLLDQVIRDSLVSYYSADLKLYQQAGR